MVYRHSIDKLLCGCGANVLIDLRAPGVRARVQETARTTDGSYLRMRRAAHHTERTQAVLNVCSAPLIMAWFTVVHLS